MFCGAGEASIKTNFKMFRNTEFSEKNLLSISGFLSNSYQVLSQKTMNVLCFHPVTISIDGNVTNQNHLQTTLEAEFLNATSF